MTSRAGVGRAVIAGPYVTAGTTPGQQTPPLIPDGTTTFTYEAATGTRPVGRFGIAGGGPAPLYPGGGIVLVPTPDLGVMRVMVWWPDATGLQLIRRGPDGRATLVRGGSPVPVTAATRRNWSTNPSADSALTGYTAGTGSPTLTNPDRTDVEGRFVRATIASAGTCEVNLPGVLPGALAATIGLDLRLSATPTAVTVTVTWLTAGGAAAGTTVGTLTAAETVFSVGQWRRQVLTVTPPSTAASGTARITATGMPAAGYVDVDRLTLETGTGDGSYVDGATLGGQWTGTAHLSSSVIAPVVTVSDGECPLDTPVQYQLANPAPTGGRMLSQTAVLSSGGRTWLTHPSSSGTPMVVDLRAVPALERAAEQGVFYPLDGEYATVVSARRRRAPTGTLGFNAVSAAERAALMGVFADLQPVLLRSPADYHYAVGYQWVALGSLTEDREGRKAWQDAWLITAPFYETAAPDPVLAA